jgi:hypothetical protein
MALTLTTAGEVLKTVYLPRIRKQIAEKNVLLMRLSRNKGELRGKEGVMALHVGRNEGIGARADNGDLPTAGEQSYDNATYICKYNYGRITVTGPTMKASQTDRAAYIRAVSSEIRGVTKDLKRDVQRQLWGTGSGELSGVSIAANDTIVIQVHSLKHIRPRMKIDIEKSTDGTEVATSVAVVSINKGASTFTLAAAITCSADHAVYRHGNRNLEIYGLDAAVSHTNPGKQVVNFGNIDRTTEDFWQSVSLTADTNRELTTDLMQEALDEIDINDGEASLGLTNHAIRRKYGDILVSDRRYNDNIMNLDGGFKALTINGVPIVTDKDAPDNRIYFLDESTLTMFEMSDWSWMDEDGAVLARISGKDAYEAVLYKYHQLGSENCSKSAVITHVAHV